jgi:hypothetical protein
MSHRCTNARILLENRNFLQLLGTLGAPSSRQSRLSMSLQQHEIGLEACPPRRPRNPVAGVPENCNMIPDDDLSHYRSRSPEKTKPKSGVCRCSWPYSKAIQGRSERLVPRRSRSPLRIPRAMAGTMACALWRRWRRLLGLLGSSGLCGRRYPPQAKPEAGSGQRKPESKPNYQERKVKIS